MNENKGNCCRNIYIKKLKIRKQTKIEDRNFANIWCTFDFISHFWSLIILLTCFIYLLIDVSVIYMMVLSLPLSASFMGYCYEKITNRFFWRCRQRIKDIHEMK